MQKDMRRAMRRHHIERLKVKRKRYWFGNLQGKQLGMAVTTPAICSCWMCGNARQIEGPTLQELRFAQSASW